MKLSNYTLSTLFSLPLLSFTFFLISCGQSPEDEYRLDDSRQEVITKITQTIDSCIGWAKEKDLDLLFSVVADDSSYLSVHPSLRVVKGFEEFKTNIPFWMNPDFQYVRHEIRDLTINLAKSGDVAWFYCILDDINEWKGEPANWENTRWTGVLEKRKNNWVIVQQHFSFPSER
jgi:hypothetical protein